MTGRAWAARQSRPEGRLEGERKKVSGLKSRRGHAVLSSVLTATGPQATYGNAEGRLKRFPTGTSLTRSYSAARRGGCTPRLSLPGTFGDGLVDYRSSIRDIAGIFLTVV